MTLALALWAGLTRAASPALRVMLRRRVARGKEIAARLPERGGDRRIAPAGGPADLAACGEPGRNRLHPSRARGPGAGAGQHPADHGHRHLPASAGAAPAAIFGLADRVLHRFIPLDVPAWGARFLDHWRPDAAAFVESEIWPNILAAAARRGVPLMLINARLSPRSLARWQRAPRTARAVLAWFAAIHPQSTADGDRFAQLGAPRVLPAGNLKLAAPPLPADRQALSHLSSLIGGPAWVAASLHRGEDELIARRPSRAWRPPIRGCSPSSRRATRSGARRSPHWPAARPAGL